MKRMFAVLSVLVLVAAGAWAYPGPNSIGIYTVTDATGPVSTCTNVAPFSQFSLYLCVTHMDPPEGGMYISGWELELHWDNTNFLGAWDLFGGLDVGQDIDDGHYFAVGEQTSLMPNAQDVVVLAALENAFYTDTTGDPIHFTISGHPGSTSFPDGSFGYQNDPGIFVSCVASTGFAGTVNGVYMSNPVFVINGDCVVGNQDTTWSGIKGLYR